MKKENTMKQNGSETMEKLMRMNEALNHLVWGKYMILLLLFCGFWLLIRTGFLPIRHAKLIMKKTLGSLFHTDKQHGITPFQAVSTALAGTLGVGSVIGVTTALTLGGPGAIFWMCISAFFGMMSKYAEVVLAIHYREHREDGYLGGPMTTLEHGCHSKFLGVLFAVLCILASFGIGNVTPANTIAVTINTYISFPPLWIGAFLAIGVGIILMGKAQSIMRFNEIIVPLVSVLYLFACCYLIFLHMDQLPHAIRLVFEDALSLDSGVGGVIGYLSSRAVHYGISRGVFSNEAGMGSSPISHASVAQVNAVEQGFWGIFEVFFDTMIVCVLTALVVLSSGLLHEGMDGASLTIACFEQGFGKAGGMIFACSIIAFAIPSILGWYYYASECIRYLFHSAWVKYVYNMIFIALLIIGCCMELSFVWEVADTLNGCMAIPNLISLLILTKTVVKLTKEYIDEHRSD